MDTIIRKRKYLDRRRREHEFTNLAAYMSRFAVEPEIKNYNMYDNLRLNNLDRKVRTIQQQYQRNTKLIHQAHHKMWQDGCHNGKIKITN